MAPTKFINLFAVVSFAVFYISLNPIAANALSVERAHVARNLNYAHAGLAKKKRGDSSKRCKPRPTTSSTPHDSKPPAYTPPPSPHTSSSSSTKPHPSPTTSSTPPPAVTPHVSTGGKKVGFAWSNNEQKSICNFKTDDTGLVYNWKLEKYPDVDVSKCGFEFIPQVWGADDAYKVPNVLVPGYAKRVLAFNEPDIPSQSNIAVDYAVKLYMQYINPLQYHGYELISPACTNSPNGFTWIKAFVKAIKDKGGRIDGVATHFYGVRSADFVSFMDKFIGEFEGYPIWVTEFAAQDYSGQNQQLNYDGIVSFLRETTAYMQGKEQIRAYFFFGAMQGWELAQNHVNELNSLMGGNNEPNALGRMYINP